MKLVVALSTLFLVPTLAQAQLDKMICIAQTHLGNGRLIGEQFSSEVEVRRVKIGNIYFEAEFSKFTSDGVGDVHLNIFGDLQAETIVHRAKLNDAQFFAQTERLNEKPFTYARLLCGNSLFPN